MEDMAHEEDAEDEVKWAEKGYLQFWCLCREPSWGNDAGCQRLPDDQMAGTALQRPESGNRKLRRFFWIMKRKCKSSLKTEK